MPAASPPAGPLAGLLTLVTGASSGIGAATAEKFAGAGSNLLLLARRRERLEQLAAQLRGDHGIETRVITSDVSDAAGVTAAFESLPAEWRSVDILVNNAGLVKGVAPEWEATPEDVDVMIDTNVKGLITMTRLCVPGMLARSRGHVINIGSIAGQETYPGGSIYNATKFATRALSRALKMDLQGTPIRVSSIDPGLVETEFSLVRYDGDTEKAAAIYADTEPLRPEDIADAVLFAATRPAHVNISEMLVFATDQAAARMIHRRPK